MIFQCRACVKLHIPRLKSTTLTVAVFSVRVTKLVDSTYEFINDNTNCCRAMLPKLVSLINLGIGFSVVKVFLFVFPVLRKRLSKYQNA